MSGIEKRANLSAGLLATKGGAMPKRIERDNAGESAAVVAISRHRNESPVSPPQNAGEGVLSRKGAASAQGFRPSYWSYDRSEAKEAPTPRKQPARLNFIAVLGILALVVSAGTLVLSQRSADVAEPRAAATAAVPPAAETAAALPPAPAAAPAKPQAVEPPSQAPAAPAPVAAAASPAPAKPAASPREIEAMIERGNEMIASGDIASARLFFQRAAEQGSARAATSVGLTYDPLFLAQAHVRGVQPDAAAAERWYRRAIAAGDTQAEIRLQQLLAKGRG